MEKKVIAIIPAAGSGQRFGKDGNKSFQPLGGKPVIVWTLEVFDSLGDIVEVIPVLKDADMEYGRSLFERYGLSKVKRIAPGGKERQDSVYSGLILVDKGTDAVLIHDGVRPLVEKELIERALQELLIPPEKSPPPPFTKGGRGGIKRGGEGGFDGVIVGVPLKDTIKGARSEKSEVRSQKKEIIVKKTLTRDLFWAVQSPQVFKYTSLMKAYKKAMDEGFYSTDDSAIVERYGGKVKIVMGSYTNIKITTPEDMDIAEVLLKKRFQR